MTKHQIERYRNELLKQQREVRGNVAGLENEALRGAGGEASGSLSNAPLHHADRGTDHFNRELSLGLLENENQTLLEIEAALDRLDRGTYGRCEQCRDEIVSERLAVVPYTRYCIACARRKEREAEPGWLE